MKLLKEIYKTYEGARKRAGFENGVARGEFERGDKAKFYAYTVVKVEDTYRVRREVRSEQNVALAHPDDCRCRVCSFSPLYIVP